MKFEVRAVSGDLACTAGQRLIALGGAPAADGDVGLPLDGDHLTLPIASDASVTYEVKLDEPGRGKLEWPAAPIERPAGSTGQGSALADKLPEGASSPGRPERGTGEAAWPSYDTSGS